MCFISHINVVNKFDETPSVKWQIRLIIGDVALSKYCYPKTCNDLTMCTFLIN